MTRCVWNDDERMILNPTCLWFDFRRVTYIDSQKLAIPTSFCEIFPFQVARQHYWAEVDCGYSQVPFLIKRFVIVRLHGQGCAGRCLIKLYLGQHEQN